MSLSARWTDEEFRKVFGAVLRELRRERGLSQEALALAAECHLNHVSFLERGLNSPTLPLTFRLAGALGVTAVELVQRVEAQLAGGQG